MFVDDVLGPAEPKRAPPWDRRAPARLRWLGAKEREEEEPGWSPAVPGRADDGQAIVERVARSRSGSRRSYSSAISGLERMKSAVARLQAIGVL